MSFDPTISAILRSPWLIEKSYADAHMPSVFRLLNGESASFAGLKPLEDETDEESKQPVTISCTLAASGKVYGVSRYTDVSLIPEGSIAVISISGPIMKNGGFCSYGMVDYTQILIRLGNADNVGGIILDTDSPGGQVYGTSTFADTIKTVKEKKPVYTVVDDGIAASAAIWFGSAGTEFWCTKPTDQVGSIGVYQTIADWKTHYQEYFKLMVKDVYADESPDKNKIYTDAIEGKEEGLKKSLSVIALQFHKEISTNRDGKLKNDSWKTGEMFYADDAKKIGLIDGIMPFDQIVQRMQQQIRKNSAKNSSNNMANENQAPVVAFKRALAAAKAEAFAVTDEGFVASEEHMNNIEASLAAGETAAAELATANATIAARDASILAHAATISTQKTLISQLEAQVAELGSEASGEGTVIETTSDLPTTKAKVRSYNDPNSVFNKAAKKRGL